MDYWNIELLDYWTLLIIAIATFGFTALHPEVALGGERRRRGAAGAFAAGRGQATSFDASCLCVPAPERRGVVRGSIPVQPHTHSQSTCTMYMYTKQQALSPPHIDLVLSSYCYTHIA